MFGIDEDANGKRIHVVKELEADRTKSVDDLLGNLPGHDCRYIVYEHEYKTKDGRKADKLFFINWNPRAAATSVQMDYLTGRPAIREVCDGCFDISASSTMDVKNGVLGTAEDDDSDAASDDGDDWLDN
mmetsp:Transcript_23644/g.75416  ORF Transcript_23644/g.75416 Transcript_23644/m.75416 type:complete len:129 (+) Transcript_23644:310-696(+)